MTRRRQEYPLIYAITTTLSQTEGDALKAIASDIGISRYKFCRQAILAYIEIHKRDAVAAYMETQDPK